MSVCVRVGNGVTVTYASTYHQLKSMSSHQREVCVQLGRYICRID